MANLVDHSELASACATAWDPEGRQVLIVPVASSPAPFAKLPLRYERCFGGADPGRPDDPATADPRNPVGRGFYADNAAAIGQPLPNVEHVKARIESRRDRPAPCGFGPIA